MICQSVFSVQSIHFVLLLFLTLFFVFPCVFLHSLLCSSLFPLTLFFFPCALLLILLPLSDKYVLSFYRQTVSINQPPFKKHPQEGRQEGRHSCRPHARKWRRSHHLKQVQGDKSVAPPVSPCKCWATRVSLLLSPQASTGRQECRPSHRLKQVQGDKSVAPPSPLPRKKAVPA